MEITEEIVIRAIDELANDQDKDTTYDNIIFEIEETEFIYSGFRDFPTLTNIEKDQVKNILKNSTKIDSYLVEKFYILEE